MCVYATDGRTEPASVNISPENGTFRQIEFVGVLDGAASPELARALRRLTCWTRPFQEDIPLQMFVYPANPDAALPDLFVQFGQTPDGSGGGRPGGDRGQPRAVDRGVDRCDAALMSAAIIAIRRAAG